MEELSILELARLLRVRYNTAYMLIREGKITASKKNGKWCITREEAERVLEERRLANEFQEK